jgi:hypothetical protein
MKGSGLRLAAVLTADADLQAGPVARPFFAISTSCRRRTDPSPQGVVFHDPCSM